MFGSGKYLSSAVAWLTGVIVSLRLEIVPARSASVGTVAYLSCGVELRWRPESAVCVVMASAGYPGAYAKGKVISGLDDAAALPGVKVFHASTALAKGQVVTSGGRVLGVTAWAGDLAAARDRALEAVARIRFEGAQYRRDIAAKALD